MLFVVEKFFERFLDWRKNWIVGEIKISLVILGWIEDSKGEKNT